MGCQFLRPCLGPADRDGPRRDRPPRPARRRTRPRRRLRHRPRHRAARARPRGHGDRRRRQRGDGGGDPRAGDRRLRLRPRRARARRARRRRPLDRDLPLDRGPRARCSRACTPRSSRAGGSPRSAAGPATSPTSRRRSTPSTSPPSAAGPARGTTPRPRRPRRASQRVGFTDVWTWLQPWPVEPADPHEYFTTVILGSHLERLPWDERSPFVDAVLSHLERPGARELRAAEHPRAPSLTLHAEAAAPCERCGA